MNSLDYNMSKEFAPTNVADMTKLSEAYEYILNLVDLVAAIEVEVNFLKETLEEIIPAECLTKRRLPPALNLPEPKVSSGLTNKLKFEI